jgi:hypothetical protein
LIIWKKKWMKKKIPNPRFQNPNKFQCPKIKFKPNLTNQGRFEN